ncbi:30S ribosomal protein S24e [Methanocella conradii]|uniref:30S ribosomal protein S24e n=1 Tax=Methanocella conradii TaxID=1175444 RepID=UPI00157C83F6|nr:30S ribosomal protein S24e [Methanocella conradii]
MDIKVLEEKKNPLLQRREVKFSVSHNLGTPSREEIKAKIAAYLNSRPELVIIERMRSEFGKRETRGYAKIYETVERLKSVEAEHIVQRNEKKKEAKKEGEAAAAEAPKAEAKPAEPKK